MSVGKRRSLSIPVVVEELAGTRRTREPVTVGIPLPKGIVSDSAELVLMNSSEELVPLQSKVLSRWSDGSIRWVLLDFQAEAGATCTSKYRVERFESDAITDTESKIALKECVDTIEVDTGAAVFVIDKTNYKPFARVVVSGMEVIDETATKILLIDRDGNEYQPIIDRVAVETIGPIRITLSFAGRFCSSRYAVAEFFSLASFYMNHGVVEIKFTIRNSRAARHRGGLWDLGDERSVYFKDLSFQCALNQPELPNILWSQGTGDAWLSNAARHFEIYQDSSGGTNWNSSNHVNRFGKIGSSFQGYRVTVDGNLLKQGTRITPTVCMKGQETQISATLEGFWQNFPKAIDVDGKKLKVRLFPRQFQDDYELQPGEQKTHRVYFSFESKQGHPPYLEWVHNRLVARATPEWYAESQAIMYISPRLFREESKSVALMESLVETAVRGSNTFFDRREVIDEYGWRNFGDIYADHEAIGNEGSTPLIAHYNNQYDVIQGSIVQYLRTGDPRWFELAKDLARHVIDIDVYHTNEDRQAFNGGLFWHTQHYTDAGTATHRAYSKAAMGSDLSHPTGGGPSSEHNYTSGLLNYYFLSGSPSAKETVIALAEWVINMDEKSKGFVGLFDRRPRGLSTMTASWRYHGPGRGAGNSLNALIDAYTLTSDEKYRDKAEALIRRCIHPHDNIEHRNFDDVEHRWSYTVFLQILGKYLDLKVEKGQLDYMFAYAKESLLHYSGWMTEHEVPYKSVLDRVEIPTETWPAQDIRKSNVFKLAAKYCDEPARPAFLEKSDYFFDRCIADLLEFPTCGLTRPIVVLMTNGFMHSYLLTRDLAAVPKPSAVYDFGRPQAFKQQFYELCKIREQMGRFVAAGICAARYAVNMLRRRRQQIVGEHA